MWEFSLLNKCDISIGGQKFRFDEHMNEIHHLWKHISIQRAEGEYTSNVIDCKWLTDNAWLPW